MSKIYKWYTGLSKRVRDSVIISATLVGTISTILSILGISLGDWKDSSVFIRIGVVIGIFLLLYIISYLTLPTAKAGGFLLLPLLYWMIPCGISMSYTVSTS